ncbi:hypothetical protein MNEG_13615 [Monoraphidium neglectum]|uniref:Zinc finger PHD-type domain-containing protein n=1 Tax=Monoraphidium neglectum TaxID=145388 RepID=A0A0D2J2X9_9CHLO|nr:hypothetical protein MNEG_13615 [Monoraphidium neglectum]KIY94347.1 hypothetical protein MNEG_13615 [Monoraphidium neglectum]|eukprot:XP_013893367.1 hypothetical protein MNEG_13615 [Monoraphidium neglectum]
MRAGSPAETGADMLLRAASAEDDAAALPEHLLRGASRPVPDAGPSKKYKPPKKRVNGVTEETYRDRWRKKQPRKNMTSWLSGVCSGCERIGPSWKALVPCAGPCLRSFHLSCVGGAGRPSAAGAAAAAAADGAAATDATGVAADGAAGASASVEGAAGAAEGAGIATDAAAEPWFCPECEAGRMRCFVCGKFGTCLEDPTMRKCSLGACGRFFHLECAKPLPLCSVGTGGGFFRCPQHYCATCGKS